MCAWPCEILDHHCHFTDELTKSQNFLALTLDSEAFHNTPWPVRTLPAPVFCDSFAATAVRITVVVAQAFKSKYPASQFLM